ncbi:hypothetical protein NP233_g10620 [Leucocoprinus birnbaumii]|uniref:Transmembrane protein n=1 Tax=Leucocoprinus birnbaumii TaxID=56174 RepID=A0AAD5VIG0_9AGAR|nr:hypothetical protein NP233_g10620 [Leucocoprinus birnbaumii]
MLVVLFIATVFSNAFIAPVTSAIDTSPLTIFSRDIPVSECVNPAGYRTMQQIILSCLATIFACTWVSLHPNVPDPRNSDWQNITMRLRTVFWAIQKIAKEYNEKFKLTPRSRSIFQYLMDGFRRHNEEMTPDTSWGLMHGFLLEMHGLRYFRSGQPFTPPDNIVDNETPIAVKISLPKAHKGIIIHLSQLSKPVDISEDEINDKSKGDFFTKLIVVIQTTWFIIQCVARWAQHLHVTELEIITLAFAILNIITYILWWNKPQHMHVAIPIHEEYNGSDVIFTEGKGKRQHSTDQVVTRPNNNYSPSERPTLADHSNSNTRRPLPDDQKASHYRRFPSNSFSLLNAALLALPRFLWTFVRKISPLRAWLTMAGNYLDAEGSSDVGYAFFSSTGSYSEDWKVDAALGLVGVLFGGVHLFPVWLSSFSMSVEQYLWLACTISILVEPVTICLLSVIESLKSRLPHWFYFSLSVPNVLLLGLGYLLYAPARLILIVLAFNSLRSLPPDTFVNVEWSSFFPHF